MVKSSKSNTILWWGRSDPNYSRNRILRKILLDEGYNLIDFKPKSSFLGGIESRLKSFGNVDAVWVPCFRQTDFTSARKFADRNRLPLIFDPLISKWDKVVFEKRKMNQYQPRAKKLLASEQQLFSGADLVLADTSLHADFFISTLHADPDRTHVVQVGAEEELFENQDFSLCEDTFEILFFGSFIALQGPEVIVEAARLLPDCDFTLLGEGPLKSTCENNAGTLPNVHFEPWVNYELLPRRIGRAAVLLGIFGDSPKAGRVIPNKVYQSLACGRAVITRESGSYPETMLKEDSGILFTKPNSPEDLARCITSLRSKKNDFIKNLGKRARATFENCFSTRVIRRQLLDTLRSVNL